MKHFILTRFNLGIYDKDNAYKKWVGDPVEWLEDRLWLFEKYCFPSLMAQTCQDFVWVLAFDEQTPIDVICKYDYCDNVVVVFEQPHLWLRRQPSESEWIITSRLDNDDFYYPGFVDLIQKEARMVKEVIDIDYVVLNAKNGKLHTSERPRANSPFLSLVEPWGDIKTCMARPHTKMPDDFPARKLGVMAVQVIHGNNVSNKIVGKLI